MLTAPPDRLLDANGRVAHFGMWNAPLPDVDLLDAKIPKRPGLGRLRLKRWQHVLLVHPDAALMWAVVDAAYLKLGWIRFVDRRSGQTREHAAKSPLLNARVARSLHDDATTLRTRRFEIEQQNQLAEGVHRARLRAPNLSANLTIEATSTPLVVNLPLGRGRSMYSHKVIHPVSGSFEVDGRTFQCDPADTFAILDIHAAHYPRRTYWNWATFVQKDESGVVGLNLTRNVVADPAFHENALWEDGELSLLSEARFDFSDESAWTCGTVDGRVDLSFTADGERREDIRAGVIESVFRQRYGRFSGRIGDRVIDGAFGLMEDHQSVW